MMLRQKFSRHGLRLLLPLLPGLAVLTLLVLVLMANDRIVERDLAQRAQFRVTQYADVFADQVSRVVSKRVAELQLTGRLLSMSHAPDMAADHAYLDALMTQTSAYDWIGWVDDNGSVIASTSRGPGPVIRTAVLSPDVARSAVPQLQLMSVLPVRAAFALEHLRPLGVLVVPLVASGASGVMVGVLSRQYFEELRQFALGDPLARRSLELTLVAANNVAVLGPLRLGSDLVRSSEPLRGVDTELKTQWYVLSTQPLSAATRPAALLQDSLVFWGLPAAILIALLGVWTSRRLARPYRAVLDAATDSSTGDAAVPGAFLRSLAAALQRLSPVLQVDAATQSFLEHIVQDAKRLQNVLDQLPSPVYLLDASDRVTFWNRQAHAMFEWSSAEAVGKPVSQLLSGQVHILGTNQPLDGSPQSFEAKTTTRSGLECWGEWHLLPLRTPSGQVEGQIVVVRDITDRVLAAERMARQQVELAELNLRLMQQEQETTSRLAQTLHDQLGQSLGAIRLAFDSLQPVWLSAAEPRHRERVSRLDLLINQAIAEIRQALIELRPPLLEEMGLAAALDNEVQMRKLDVLPSALDLIVEPGVLETRWPHDVERAAFMIAREAIVNAARHANANLIQLRLSGSPQEVTLSIEDDGVGMAISSQLHHPGHLGLVGMRERALAIGAQLEVGPASPQGLRVSLRWTATPSLNRTISQAQP